MRKYKSVKKRPPVSVSPVEEGTAVNRVARLTDLMDLPQELIALGATNGFNPRPFIKTRRWLYGPPKEGKTCLIAEQERTLIIDTEDGSGSAPLHPSSARVVIKSWDDFDKVMKYLPNSDGLFDHVVLDTIDRFMPHLMEQLSKELRQDVTMYGGGKGGWRKISDRIATILSDWRRWGYGWTVIGHVAWRPFRRPSDGVEVSEMGPTVTPLVNGVLRQEADFLMQLSTEFQSVAVEVEGSKLPRTEYVKQRVLRIQSPEDKPVSSIDLGSRVPMPEIIVLERSGGINQLREAYDEGVESERQRIAELYGDS